jgi:hypothetical protein
MDLQNTLIVSATPAIINVNFDALKEALSTELAKYDVTVTEDTLADAKKLCADLNKSKGHIAKVRKEQANIASEPVQKFERQMREFETEVETARIKIKQQVDKFENERKELLKQLLEGLCQDLWVSSDVHPEFQNVVIDDLVMLSNITGKGNISSKAKAAVQARVSQNKIWQNQIERRLLELENKCFRAGLKVPLTKEHVAAFLYMEDETQYEGRLSSLISVEIKRAEEVEAATRAQVAKEQEQTAAASEAQEATEDPEPDQPPAEEGETQAQEGQEPPPVEERTGHMMGNGACGKVNVRVVCEFDIQIPPTTSMKDVESAYRAKLEKSGFKTLSAVRVQPV